MEAKGVLKTKSAISKPQITTHFIKHLKPNTDLSEQAESTYNGSIQQASTYRSVQIKRATACKVLVTIDYCKINIEVKYRKSTLHKNQLLANHSITY